MKIKFIGSKSSYQVKGLEMSNKERKAQKKDTHYYLTNTESRDLVTSINSHAVVIMAWLYNYSARGSNKISNSKIAEGTGLTPNIVKKVMPKLKELGYYANFNIGNGYSRLIIGRKAVVVESGYMDAVNKLCTSPDWKKVILDSYAENSNLKVTKTVEELCTNMIIDGLTIDMLEYLVREDP